MYEKQQWIDNETPLSAQRLNHMEEGIESNAGELQKVYDSNKIYKAGGTASSLEITTDNGTFVYVNGMPIQVEITAAGVIDTVDIDGKGAVSVLDKSDEPLEVEVGDLIILKYDDEGEVPFFLGASRGGGVKLKGTEFMERLTTDNVSKNDYLEFYSYYVRKSRYNLTLDEALTSSDRCDNTGDKFQYAIIKVTETFYIMGLVDFDANSWRIYEFVLSNNSNKVVTKLILETYTDLTAGSYDVNAALISANEIVFTIGPMLFYYNVNTNAYLRTSNKEFGYCKMCTLNDGRIIIVGWNTSPYYMLVSELTHDGDMTFTQNSLTTINSIAHNRPYSILPVDDNKFVILGYDATNYFRYYLMSYDDGVFSLLDTYVPSNYLAVSLSISEMIKIDDSIFNIHRPSSSSIVTLYKFSLDLALDEINFDLSITGNTNTSFNGAIVKMSNDVIYVINSNNSSGMIFTRNDGGIWSYQGYGQLPFVATGGNNQQHQLILLDDFKALGIYAFGYPYAYIFRAIKQVNAISLEDATPGTEIKILIP